MRDQYQVAYWERSTDQIGIWLQGALVPVSTGLSVHQARSDAKKLSTYEQANNLFGVVVYKRIGETWVAIETYVNGELVS